MVRRRQDLPGWLPSVGLAMGVAILTVECAVVVRFSLSAAQGHGVLAPLWQTLVGYWAVLVPCDLLALAALRRAGSPAGGLRPTGIRVGVSTAVVATLAGIGGQGEVAVLVVPAGILAWIGHTRWVWPLAVGVAVFSLWPAVPTEPRVPPDVALEPPATPSIALIVLDTVRADRTSAYGHPFDTTPNLARLAARGIRFERAYSTSCWSLPSHASLLTGLLPREHGAHHENHRLAAQSPTLPELLAAHGYETVGFSANPWISDGTGLSRGFERFEGIWSDYVIRELLLFWRIWWRLTAPHLDKGGAVALERIRHWHRSRNPERPFFLFVNLLEAHAPYNHVPEASLRAFLPEGVPLADANEVGEEWFAGIMDGVMDPGLDRDLALRLLDAAIHAVDAYLGEILGVVGDEVVVVVISDHGELVGEHGLFGHNQSLYEPVIRIPMVMAGPGIPAGRTVASLASIVDVMPTLLAIGGVPMASHGGIDLLELLREGERHRTIQAEQMRPGSMAVSPLPHGDAARVAHHTARKVAVVHGWHKRVVDELGADHTFDLLADPLELEPLADSAGMVRPEPPRRIADDASAAAGPELSAAERGRLEALGYLGVGR